MNKIRIIGIDKNIFKIKTNIKIKSIFIMEIVKQNESFNVKDANDTFEMNGSISREVSGSLNLYFNVSRVGGEHVGDCHYNKYGENSNVNFGVNCAEENRDELTAYADTVVDSVLEYFKNL